MPLAYHFNGSRKGGCERCWWVYKRPCSGNTYLGEACRECGVHGEQEKCTFRMAYVVPLAEMIENLERNPQKECKLLSSLPSEIRMIIWSYALTGDDGALDPDTIAYHLLETCRQIYLETYRLPFQLNSPLFGRRWRSRERRHQDRLLSCAPWQIGLLQSLDFLVSPNPKMLSSIFLKHISAENMFVRERHAGADILGHYFVPFYPGVMPFNDFGPLPSGEQKQYLPHSLIQEHPEEIARATLFSKLPAYRSPALPLTTLRLRVRRMSWVGTTGSCILDESRKPAMLDPFTESAIADDIMLRHAHGHSDPPQRRSLATCLSEYYPSLTTVAFIFEGFTYQNNDLAILIERAKTWIFRIGCYKLEWDGVEHPEQVKLDTIEHIRDGYLGLYGNTNNYFANCPNELSPEYTVPSAQLKEFLDAGGNEKRHCPIDADVILVRRIYFRRSSHSCE